jgi:CopC domain
MKRFIPLLLVVVVLALGITSPAKAHAHLVSSVPKAGEGLAQSPPEIVLEYSEDLDPAYTKVELLDTNGQVVVPGPGVIEPSAPRRLRRGIQRSVAGALCHRWACHQRQCGIFNRRIKSTRIPFTSSWNT